MNITFHYKRCAPFANNYTVNHAAELAVVVMQAQSLQKALFKGGGEDRAPGPMHYSSLRVSSHPRFLLELV